MLTARMRRLAEGDVVRRWPISTARTKSARWPGALEIFVENETERRSLQTHRAGPTQPAGAPEDCRSPDRNLRARRPRRSRPGQRQQQAHGADRGVSRCDRARHFRQGFSVAGSSEVAQSSVQTVASAAEELSASISEIGRQIGQNQGSRHECNPCRQRFQRQGRKPRQRAQKIGEVVSLIQAIAEQTTCWR